MLAYPAGNRRNTDPTANDHKDVVPKVEHLPIPHPDWSPENGEKQSIPYGDQPFRELDPAVSLLKSLANSCRTLTWATEGMAATFWRATSASVDIMLIHSYAVYIDMFINSANFLTVTGTCRYGDTSCTPFV